MSRSAELTRLLQARFAELQRRNPRYSLRAFARDLGLSVGATSELLRGLRRVSEKKEAAICERLAKLGKRS